MGLENAPFMEYQPDIYINVCLKQVSEKSGPYAVLMLTPPSTAQVWPVT